jgi:hypothetical protein
MVVANAASLPLADGRRVLRFFCEPDGPTCSGLSFLLWLRRELHGELADPARLEPTLQLDEALGDVRERLLPEAARQQERFLVAVDDVHRASSCPYWGEPTVRKTIDELRRADAGRELLAFLLTAIPGSRRELKLPGTEVVLGPQDNPEFGALSRAGAGYSIWREIGGHLHPLRRDVLRMLEAAGRPLTARQVAAALEKPSFLVRHELRGLRSVLDVEEAEEDTFRLYSAILHSELDATGSEAEGWSARIAALDEELAAQEARRA